MTDVIIHAAPIWDSVFLKLSKYLKLVYQHFYKSFCFVSGIPVTSFKPALNAFPSRKNQFLTNEINNEEPHLPPCTDTKHLWTACECHLELCIGWYPCGLKYCKGKGQSKGSVISYRCGIKTCKMCHMFAYYVSQKQQCLWDEWP